MTESKKRRVHPPEFKAKVGLEALGGMKTINQIAQEHGVHPIQVGQWKREIQAQAKSLFEGKRGPQPVSAESAPDRLYGEIGRLKMELDWLKKSLGSACHDPTHGEPLGSPKSRATVRQENRDPQAGNGRGD